jgi:hypothetical protein
MGKSSQRQGFLMDRRFSTIDILSDFNYLAAAAALLGSLHTTAIQT